MRRWPVLLAGFALMALGILAWAYGAWTDQLRIDRLPAPAIEWTVEP